MTSLGRWLVGILNAHIERHNVPVAEPAPDTPLARFYIGQLDVEAAQLAEDVRQHVPVGPPRPAVDGPVVELEWTPLVRPCWACGSPGGFHAAHRCDTHFDTTGGAARRAPAPTPSRLTVLDDGEASPASTWRRQ